MSFPSFAFGFVFRMVELGAVPLLVAAGVCLLLDQFLHPRGRGGSKVIPDLEPLQFAPLSFGRTRYTVHGFKEEARQKLVVLVHGLSTPSVVYFELAKLLVKGGFVVLTYDNYGRGFSESEDVKHTAGLFVSQLTELLEWVQPSLPPAREPFHLLGYSMGGTIVTNFASLFPHRIDKLCLVAPAAINPRPAGLAFTHVPGLRQLVMTYYLMKLYWKGMQATCVNLIRNDQAEFAAKLHAEFGAQIQGYYARSLLSTLRHCPEMFDNRVALERLALHVQRGLRVLIVWGKEDEVCSFASAEPVRQLLAGNGDNVEVVGVPGAQHDFPIVDVDSLHRPLLAFLSSS